MAKPTAQKADELEQVLEAAGIKQRLGGLMFEKYNWHQSLSARQFPRELLLSESEVEERMIRAGSRIKAGVVNLAFDRISSSGSVPSIHWALRGKGKGPGEFLALIAAIRESILLEGLVAPSGHTQHITISYRAPETLKTLKLERGFGWRVDQILLVKVQGSPYRYEVVTEWPLIAEAQLPLF